MAKKEDEYKRQLEGLGVYDPAFDGAIHQLCILERELSRARKQWAATSPEGTAPSLSHPLYGVILQIQREAMAYRDALGLTPKSLKKLKGQVGSSAPPAGVQNPLEVILSRHGANRKTNTQD